MGFNVQINLYIIANHGCRRIGNAIILAINGYPGMRAHYFSFAAVEGAFHVKRQVNVF